jgi:metallo-beta-lactamase family protein
MKIHFLGGVETVTGSQHLVEAGGLRILRDCGLYQGRRKESREVNSRFPFDVGSLDAVVLSHAHIDHCGNIPSLARAGYRGPIHATTATAALCEIMLRDSAHIQEQDAAYLNQKTNRKGLEPVVPLYTLNDAEDAIRLFRGHLYGDPVDLSPALSVTFSNAGHILGAALTTFTVRENGRTLRVAFAVDLGRRNLPLIRDPDVLRDIDVMIVESTYGNRLHDDAEQEEEQLAAAVEKTIRRGGKVMIPSFALERAQEVIYLLASLFDSGRLPQVPVYVDSPMAEAVSGVFDKSASYLDEDFIRLRDKIGRVMHQKWLKYTSSVEESKAITASTKPSIVISASGMCEHGRILHHLKHGIENPLNTIVIVGFQAQHTLGRRLLDGETEVMIFGDWFKRQAEVIALNAFSAHADRAELTEYVRQVNPKKLYLVHGEPEQRTALATALKTAGFKDAFEPSQGEVVEI